MRLELSTTLPNLRYGYKFVSLLKSMENEFVHGLSSNADVESETSIVYYSIKM